MSPFTVILLALGATIAVSEVDEYDRRLDQIEKVACAPDASLTDAQILAYRASDPLVSASINIC